MDGMTGTNWYILFKDWAGEDFKIMPQYEKHTHGVKKIIIGHMVSGPFLPAEEKLKRYGQNIVYHQCFGLDGKCYEARPLEFKPALIYGHNDGTCAVALIANTCANSNVKINDLVVQSWARMLAHLALRLDLGTLVWGENVMGQRDIDPAKFPESPGPKFYEHKDQIIELANTFIASPINYMSGDLLQ